MWRAAADENQAEADSVESSVESRMQIWRAESAGGQADLFVKRLKWEGIIAETATGLLRDNIGGPDPDAPAWREFFEHFRLHEEGGAESPWTGMVDAVLAGCKAPFSSACRPFLLASLDIFDSRGSASANVGLGPDVIADSVRSLLRELCRLAAPILMERFQIWLRQKEALPDFEKRMNHDSFIDGLTYGGLWVEILSEYAGLARLMAIISLGWSAELREFLERFRADREDLRTVFLSSVPEAEFPVLMAVEAGISDRHNGAGTVRVLEFSNGRKLVYKRRPLELEADFYELLRELKSRGLPWAPPALRVLPRNGYGWVEFAVAKPVEGDRGALENWFHSAGALLCLMHLLGGNDGHMENVIALKEGPVLIDLETLLQPGPGLSGPGAGTGTFSQAARRVQDSVMQTGLLPLWQRGRQGALYDIGGLTGEGGYESPALRAVWENVGTDGIQSVWRRPITRGLDNLPVWNGRRHPAARHLPALCGGFAETWRFLQSHLELVRSALQKWRTAPLRVLLRPTTHYASLLERSLAADALKAGIDRSLIFEALYRPFLQNHEERPPMWPAVRQEIEALEAGDIPLFFVRADGRDLGTAHGACVVENAFSQSALESALTKLNSLTEPGLRQQLEMIASAFIRPGGGGAGDAPPVEAPSVEIDYDALLRDTPLISSAGLTKSADFLGRQIIQSAIRGKDGFVTWLSPTLLHPDKQEQRGGSYYLYDGAAGIAVFLAALARVTGSAPAKATALAALEPVRAILEAPNADTLVSREGIGGCSGLGSLVYSFTLISRLLEMPELLERALLLSKLITEPRIARDQSLDIVSGSAGAILGLLALHRAAGDPDVLRRAVLCGDHLLARAVRVGDDALAWMSCPDRLLLAGYSHGTAGIASALRGLFKASGEQRFGDAAMAALRYERGLFDVDAGNWPILLPGGGSRLACTWCHGAPGILLSRAGFSDQSGTGDDAVLQFERAVATRTTLAAGLSAVDHLCCGTMGRVAILQDTADGGPANRQMQLAQLGATLTIRRAQQRKAFSLQTDAVRNSVFQPGFFRGSSGIGYTLLRLARPDLVPSVLLWDI